MRITAKLSVAYLLVALSLLSKVSLAQLTTGDISFVAFNADGDDDFAFVALADIPANTIIYFTDNEPTGATSVNTGEGAISWSHSSIVSAGSIIVINDADNASPSTNIGTASDGTGSFNLAAGGDALFAFIGTNDTSPTTWLAGIQNESGNQGGSLAAAGLTSGSTFIDFYSSGNPDGGYYNGARTGQANFSDYLTIIANASWEIESSNGENILPISTTAFTTSIACTPPTNQANNLSISSIGDNTATVSWSRGNGDSILVIAQEDLAVSSDPANGTIYSADANFGDGSTVSTDVYAVYRATGTSVNLTGLSDTTTYHLALYEFNGTGICYRSSDELTGSFTTTCSTPGNVFGISANAFSSQVSIDWTLPSCYNEVMVVARAGSAVSASPSGNGSSYTANANFGSGTDIGSNEYVVYKGTGQNITVSGLTNGTTYHFTVFTRKSSTWSSGNSTSATPTDVPDSDALVITAVFDGPLSGGTPKGIELYARKDITDLSYFALGRATNGDGTNDAESQLDAVSLSAGEYYYVASSSTNFNTWFGFLHDQTSSVASINGDDAVQLFFDATKAFSGSETQTDVFGDKDTDGTGEAWEYLDGWAYRVDGTGPDGTTFETSNWTFSGTNALDGESTNASASNPVPVGTHFNSYIYDDGIWSPSSPAGLTVGTRKVVVQSGSVTVSSFEIGDIEIESGSTININTGTVTVNGTITNNGTVNVASGAAILQTANSNGNSGSGTYNITRSSGTLVDDTRYQYWSSPTNNASMGSVFASSNSSDFYYFNESTQAWSSQASGNTMTPGRGYATTGSVGSTGFTDSRTFGGTINNGDVALSTSSVSSGDMILVGNPYPSAIASASFIADNGGINGTLWFWDHATAESGGNNDPNDYATWNGTGGAGAGGESPDDYVQSCQGFFVQSNSSNPTITFENDQRVADNNTQFFKQTLQDERQRFWMSLSNEVGDENQLLIGLIPDATEGVDRMYDGFKFKGNPKLSFYSMINQDEYAIQGLPYLGIEESRIIPLGLDVWEHGNYTIALDSLSNWPESHSLHLIDYQLDTAVDLRKQAYLIEVDSTGMFTNRFAVRINHIISASDDLGINDDVGQDEGALSAVELLDNKVKLFARRNEIVVESSELKVERILVYDVNGRSCLDQEFSQNNIAVEWNNGGIYFVQVFLKGGIVQKAKLVF
jgi:hypothetical protein